MNIELKDTIKLMESEDFQERLVAEYLQTKIRYAKLNDAIIKADFDTDLLEEQADIMHEYLFVLEKRLEALNIEVEKI